MFWDDFEFDYKLDMQEVFLEMAAIGGKGLSNKPLAIPTVR